MTQSHVDTNTPAAVSKNAPYTVQLEIQTVPEDRPAPNTRQERRKKSHKVTVELPMEADIVEGKWAAGFCGCFKSCVPNCCMATFCPCFSVAQIAARLGVASYWCALITSLVAIIVENVAFALAASEISDIYSTVSELYPGNPAYGYNRYGESSTCALYRFVTVLVHLLLSVFVWQLRMKTRERFNIPGGCCTDCCASLCCSCCTLAQMATHLKTYKPGSCNFARSVATLPAYK